MPSSIPFRPEAVELCAITEARHVDKIHRPVSIFRQSFVDYACNTAHLRHYIPKVPGNPIIETTTIPTIPRPETQVRVRMQSAKHFVRPPLLSRRMGTGGARASEHVLSGLWVLLRGPGQLGIDGAEIYAAH